MLDKIVAASPDFKVKLKTPVTGVRFTEDPRLLQVKVGKEWQSKKYRSVINSVPLGCMQRMDLRGASLNYGTKLAIRSLGYGASCKVGVRFKKMWWINKFGVSDGGIGKTDLPIRVCVYPSYNIYEDAEKGGVLLVSYTWTQDAERMGSLINNDKPAEGDELKELIIYNLALLHTSADKKFDDVYKEISESYDSHYAWDWGQDEFATGAFAQFGPSQFSSMYPSVVMNNGKHIIVGEASSPHHAWIVGALESAVRGVYQFLYAHSKYDKCNEALKLWDAPEEFPVEQRLTAPFYPLPEEYDQLLKQPEGIETKRNFLAKHLVLLSKAEIEAELSERRK
jgi:monoamine oxidase